MSTHNIGLNEDLKKIIFELSSNTHLISSPADDFDLTYRSVLPAEVRGTKNRQLSLSLEPADGVLKVSSVLQNLSSWFPTRSDTNWAVQS